jgi:hypothetical protein
METLMRASRDQPTYPDLGSLEHVLAALLSFGYPVAIRREANTSPHSFQSAVTRLKRMGWTLKVVRRTKYLPRDATVYVLTGLQVVRAKDGVASIIAINDIPGQLDDG